MGGFPDTSLTTQEELKAEPETFYVFQPRDRADHHAENLPAVQGHQAPVFTEDDLMQTADFFETGMQYMVKSRAIGSRFYMEGPGFFRSEDFKRRVGRIQVETKVHGLIRDMKQQRQDSGGRRCLIGVPSQMYALAAMRQDSARKQCS